MYFITRNPGEFFSASSYRKEARAQLKGHWKEAIMLSAVPALIFMVLGISVVYSIYSISGMTFSTLQESSSSDTNIVIQQAPNIISSLFVASISFSMLRFVRKLQSHFDWKKDLLYIFRLPFFWKLLGLEILKNIFISLWTLLFIVPGIIKMYSYSQASFIMYDYLIENSDSELSIMDAITASRKMMKGRKMDKFVLDLSFLGWYILTLLTLGLGMIVLQPYIIMSDVIFYESIRLQTRNLSNQEIHELFQKQQFMEETGIIGEDPDDFSDF